MLRRLLLALCCCLVAGLAGADEAKPLIFGVLNQQSPAKTAQRWNPILKYLTDVTGIPLQLRMGVTVQETDAMLGRGEFDLAYTNHNFQAEYDGKYRVIARWSDKPIVGVIAVLADSPLRRLSDLAGKRVAFPSMDAFVAYAVPTVALRAAKLRVQPVFANNQEGVLAQLKARQVDAAAVNSRSLTRYAAEQGLEYREIFVSPPYADIPVIANNRLPPDKVDVLQKALLAMATDPRAVAALTAAGFTGFAAAGDRDYDDQRRIYRRIAE